MVLSIVRSWVIFSDRFVAHGTSVSKLARMLAPLLCASCAPAAGLRSSAPAAADSSPTTAAAGQPQRDGARDFDWDIGTWGFSADGGKTWEPNFIVEETLVRGG
jgi:hypothetical protein